MVQSHQLRFHPEALVPVEMRRGQHGDGDDGTVLISLEDLVRPRKDRYQHRCTDAAGRP